MTPRTRNNLIFAVILFLIGIGVYLNAVPNGFVWDDKNLILNNPDIQSINPANIKTLFTHDLIYRIDRSNFYRPLQSFSYMFDFVLWGKAAAGFHITNAVIHSLNGCLIFLLLLLLFGNPAASFIGALFFIVHPLQTSAVTYIAGRADLLALFFLLSATFFMFKNRDNDSLSSLVLCAASFMLALLSKELSVVFPVFALIYLWLDGEKHDKKGHKLFYVLAAIGLIYLLLRMTVLKFTSFESQAINPPPLGMRALLLWPVVVTYFRLIIAPYDLRMDRDITIPNSIIDPTVLASIVIIIAAVAIFWRPLKKNRTLRLGCGWFFIFLFPSLNIIVPLNAPISEHWLYIPFFGISIAATAGIAWILNVNVRARHAVPLRRVWTVSIIAIILISAYAATTIYVNQFWKDENTLFSYIGKFKKVHFRAHLNLGTQYYEAGNYREAIVEFEKVLKRAPDDYNTLVLMAASHARLHHSESALRYFKEAVRSNSASADAYIIFSQALADTGQKEAAKNLLEKAVMINPKNPVAYNSLGIMYADTGMVEKAKEAWTKGLEIDPASKEIANNLKRLEVLMDKARQFEAHMSNMNKLVQEGKYDLAVEEAKKAIAINPKSVTAQNNLGVLYGMLSRDAEAVEQFKKVAKLSPAESGAYKNIGIIYSKYRDKRKEASEYFEKYLTANPKAEDRDLIEQKIQELSSAH